MPSKSDRPAGSPSDVADLDGLDAAIQANQELMALVDGSSRSPSEDPYDYLRLLRAWMDRA